MNHKLLLGILFFLISCSTAERPTLELIGSEGFDQSSSSKAVTTEELKESSVSVTNSFDETLSEIDRTSTSFLLSFREAGVAQDRIKFFIARYSKSSPTFKNKETLFKTDKFEYKVKREENNNGVFFVVNCTENNFTQTKKSERNAKNLARFMKKGALEAKLLEE